MKREEQIKKLEDIYTDDASNADKHIDSNGKELLYVVHKTAERTKKEFIIKACDYLYKLNRMNFNEYGKNCPLVNVSDFRKAMEE